MYCTPSSLHSHSIGQAKPNADKLPLYTLSDSQILRFAVLFRWQGGVHGTHCRPPPLSLCDSINRRVSAHMSMSYLVHHVSIRWWRALRSALRFCAPPSAAVHHHGILVFLIPDSWPCIAGAGEGLLYPCYHHITAFERSMMHPHPRPVGVH